MNANSNPRSVIHKAALALNWALLAICGIALIALLFYFPDRVNISIIFPFLPHAMAIIALQSASNRVLAAAAMLANGVMIVAATAVVSVALAGRIDQPLAMGSVSLVSLISANLNFALIGWKWLRPLASKLAQKMLR